LFLSEDGLEVVRVDCGVASILSFRIDVPSSSESIWFCAEMTRVESDDKVKLEEVLGLLRLPLGQYLGSRKILKVLMICNNVDCCGNHLSQGQMISLTSKPLSRVIMWEFHKRTRQGVSVKLESYIY